MIKITHRIIRKVTYIILAVIVSTIYGVVFYYWGGDLASGISLALIFLCLPFFAIFKYLFNRQLKQKIKQQIPYQKIKQYLSARQIDQENLRSDLLNWCGQYLFLESKHNDYFQYKNLSAIYKMEFEQVKLQKTEMIYEIDKMRTSSNLADAYVGQVLYRIFNLSSLLAGEAEKMCIKIATAFAIYHPEELKLLFEITK